MSENKQEPRTGVINFNSINIDFLQFEDEICVDCEEARDEINNNDSLSEEERENLLQDFECDSSHMKLLGDWEKGKDGKYFPSKDGEYAAIERESVFQIVYSKFTAKGNFCSPCYPNQVDLDSEGDILGYTFPPYFFEDI